MVIIITTFGSSPYRSIIHIIFAGVDFPVIQDPFKFSLENLVGHDQEMGILHRYWNLNGSSVYDAVTGEKLT